MLRDRKRGVALRYRFFGDISVQGFFIIFFYIQTMFLSVRYIKFHNIYNYIYQCNKYIPVKSTEYLGKFVEGIQTNAISINEQVC